MQRIIELNDCYKLKAFYNKRLFVHFEPTWRPAERARGFIVLCVTKYVIHIIKPSNLKMNAINFPDILVISYHTARKPQNVVRVPLGWRLIKLQARE